MTINSLEWVAMPLIIYVPLITRVLLLTSVILSFHVIQAGVGVRASWDTSVWRWCSIAAQTGLKWSRKEREELAEGWLVEQILVRVLSFSRFFTGFLETNENVAYILQ